MLVDAGSGGDEWDSGDWVASMADVVEVPGWLVVRDMQWQPDAGVVAGEFVGTSVGAGADQLVVVPDDEEPLLVVPDDDEAYAAVRDRQGRWSRTVADMAPGAGLAGELAGLVTDSGAGDPHAGLDTVSEFELGEVTAACQRLMSWVRGVQAAAVTRLSRSPVLAPKPSGAEYASVSARTCTALELVEPMRLTTAQAEALVAESVQLVDDFPSTHTALTAGAIDERCARIILGELGRQDEDVAQTVEAAALAGAAGMNTRQLRRRIKTLIHQLAPAAAEERHQRAVESRHVRVSPAEDGMAWLEALLPAEDAMAVKTVLDAGQKTLKRHDAETGDARARTADQRRADTLAHLAWTTLSNGRIGLSPARTGASTNDPVSVTGSSFGQATGIDLSSAHGRPVSVHVTVPLSTLIGLGDQAGYLAGYGPVPADVARHLSTAGVWQWVGTHNVTGAALNHGRTRYTPTRDLIDHVILRDRTCRAPGCDALPDRCDVDHTTPFGVGSTNASNLGLFCRHHHLLKHHSRWRVEQPEPGVFVWTSPTGRTTTIATRGPD